MAKGNFSACLAVTLPHEGGWADHPKDPGGATMKGITLGTFRRYVPGASKSDLRAISDKWVELIYRDGYWEPVRGDDLPAGVDLAVFDFGVNSGPSRAARHLQAAVGVTQDGKIGSGTIGAVFARSAVEVVKAVCARRLGFVRGLSTFSTFGRGWSRRIADVEARGVKMALAGSGASVASRLHLEAAAAEDRSASQDKGAGGAAVSGGVVGAGGVGGDVNWWIIAGVAVLAVAVVALVKSRANINRERAMAYRAAAAS